MTDITNEQLKADVLIEALPYFQQFYGATVLVKFGGSAMEDPERMHDVLRDVAFMQVAGMRPIIVHGGGKAISAELARQNVEVKFINGLRYTDGATIRVVDRVLHETINAALVSYLREQCGTDAVAVSGKNVLRCERITTKVAGSDEPVDLGYVGKVVNVDTPQLDWILGRRQIPVIAPLATDLKGDTYNKEEDLLPLRDFEQLGRRLHAAADDDTRDAVGEEAFEQLAALLGGTLVQVGHFDLADDLGTLEGEKLIEAAELHTGAVQLRRTDVPRVVGRGYQALQAERLLEILGVYHCMTSPGR